MTERRASWFLSLAVAPLQHTTSALMLISSPFLLINAPQGGIYALSWSEDNKRVITASGDKTVKVGGIFPSFELGMIVDCSSGMLRRTLR